MVSAKGCWQERQFDESGPHYKWCDHWNNFIQDMIYMICIYTVVNLDQPKNIKVKVNKCVSFYLDIKIE